MYLSRQFANPNWLMHNAGFMKILRAFGTGIFLVIIAAMMPAVFAEFSKTLVVFLKSSQQAFTAAGVLASHAAMLQ